MGLFVTQLGHSGFQIHKSESPSLHLRALYRSELKIESQSMLHRNLSHNSPLDNSSIAQWPMPLSGSLSVFAKLVEVICSSGRGRDGLVSPLIS